MKYIESSEFTSPSLHVPIIDVRSPLEYQKGHIFGAINIPMFTDTERSEVGTVYRKLGRMPAIEKGLSIVGPKLMALALKAKDLAAAKERKVYCWRGGMRSEKMAWLFETAGLDCGVLRGGYKAYRNQMITDFNNISELIILHGSTGSGKTEILYELQQRGEQIIDLEKLARHKGSAFGHIGMVNQPTSQQFQNDIYNALLSLDPQKPIWVECESQKIGQVNLPDSLWQRMKTARVVEISVERPFRVTRLNDEYGRLPGLELIRSVSRLDGQIAKEKLNRATGLIMAKNTAAAIEIILDYYDRAYEFTRKRFRNKSILTLNMCSSDPAANAERILKRLKESVVY